MPKGSQQTGSSTSSAESRAGAAQFPYFQAGLKQAGDIYGDPGAYPNYAPPDPRQISGYNDIANTGNNLGGWPTARQYDAYANLITGGGTSPAQPGYAQFAAGQGGPQQTADRVVGNAVNAAYGYANPAADYANQAAASGAGYGSTIADYANRATGGNLGLSQLGDVASGKFTNAESNPYLRSMVDAALRPVSEQYAMSTAPTLDARFSGGGRYGSGAADAAAASARDAYARNAGEISTGMYGRAYESERGRQDTAAQQYDAAIRAGLGLGITGNQAASEAARMGLATGISGLGAAGNLVNQGQQLALNAADLTQRGQLAGLSGLDTGLTRQLSTQAQALRDYNNFAAGQMIPGQANIQGGAGLQTLQQQEYNAPFERLKQYMQTIGAPSGGASATQPIFGNPITSTISGLSGAVGLGKELGLGSLFGGGAGAGASALGGPAAAAGMQALFPSVAASALPAYAAAAGGAETLASAAAFAPLAAGAATIICTELVRQGRMPNTWRLAGMRQFMRYPAIARRGYWVWATPVVAHLRKKPDSCFSKVIERTFNWRAEDLAARNGVKGARRLIRGRLVTAAMVLPCLACGLVARRDYFPSGKDAPA